MKEKGSREKYGSPEGHFHLVSVVSLSESGADIDWKVFLRELVGLVKMEILLDPVVLEGPFGITGFVVISTSHISFHLYPQTNEMHLDVYSCRPFSPEDVDAFVRDRLPVGHIVTRFGRRPSAAKVEEMG